MYTFIVIIHIILPFSTSFLFPFSLNIGKISRESSRPLLTERSIENTFMRR